MNNLFLILFLLSSFAIVIALIKPRWLGLQSRLKALGITFVASLIFLIGFGYTIPESEKITEQEKREEIKQEEEKEKKEEAEAKEKEEKEKAEAEEKKEKEKAKAEKEQEEKEKKAKAEKEQEEKDKKAKAEKEQEEKDKKAKAKKEQEEKPEYKIKEAMDDVSLAESISVKGSFKEPLAIQVEFLAKDNLTKNMTVDGIKIAIIDVVYGIKELGYEVENLGVSAKLPLVDEYGNEENEYVIKSDFGEETINKLSDDKFMINTDKLDVIADSWWEHPAIRK